MQLKDKLEAYGLVKENEPLSSHTTYRIGGNADYYIYPENVTSLMCILDILKEEQIPYFILGRGSNVLFRDEQFHGAIINLDKYINDFYFEDDGIVVAEAGCGLISLAVEAANRSLSGLEFASGIPGSVGGALYMNAGAYKSDVSSILIDVLVLKDGEAVWIPKEDLGYSYRSSLFQKHKDWTILAGRFKLAAKNEQDIRNLMASRRERRFATQPLEKPCAGSVFRNPEEMPAWQIVEKLGLRGKKVGGACVSEKHSNFIVNDDGSATCSDVLCLIEEIQTRAEKEFGIRLIREVEFLGFQ